MRNVNLGSTEVNPPLSDVYLEKWDLAENGFHAPMVVSRFWWKREMAHSSGW